MCSIRNKLIRATCVDGVYYNQVTNTIVLTQEIYVGDIYYGAKDWIVVD